MRTRGALHSARTREGGGKSVTPRCAARCAAKAGGTRAATGVHSAQPCVPPPDEHSPPGATPRRAASCRCDALRNARAMAAADVLNLDDAAVRAASFSVASMGRLTDAAWSCITCYLPPRDLAACAATCRTLRAYACNQELWAAFALKAGGMPRVASDWRAAYVAGYGSARGAAHAAHAAATSCPQATAAWGARAHGEAEEGEQHGAAASACAPWLHSAEADALPVLLSHLTPAAAASVRAILAPKTRLRPVASQHLFNLYARSHAEVHAFEPLFWGATASGADVRPAAAVAAAAAAAAHATTPGCGASVVDAAALMVAGVKHAVGTGHPSATAYAYPAVVPRVRAAALTPAVFESLFEAMRLPFICEDAVEAWPAAQGRWAPDALAQACGDAKFRMSHRFGALHGREVKVTATMAEYVAYMRAQADELPLYIFDPKFGERVPTLLQDYTPAAFPWLRQDYFACLGRAGRPDFRWLVVGPARTGAPWHVDPHHTSAWNVLLHGRKRWALYPPGVMPPGVSVRTDAGGRVIDFAAGMSPIQWYLEVYPTLSLDEVRVRAHACT
ncbi:hypothetical protein EON62_00030 [archaeon]|nr:MAG: hypothetical protein EON62_00030 [archaeon]